MKSLSLTPVEISEFSLACEKGLSLATFVPNFVVIQHLLHVILAFFMNIFGIIPEIDRGFSISLSLTSLSL